MELVMIHKIKIEKSYADAIIEGRKNFEVRYNDRGYNAGDLVCFTVIDSDKKVIRHELSNFFYRIIYVHSGLGLQEGYVVFGIEQIKLGIEHINTDTGDIMDWLREILEDVKG